MKVLFVISAFYDENSNELIKYRTGHAITAQKICQHFSDNIDVDVLVTGKPARGIRLEYAKVLDTSVFGILTGLKLKDIARFSLGKTIKENLKAVMQRMIYRKSIKYLHNNYDVVSVHDLNEVNAGIVEYCFEKRIACLATWHFYVGKNYLFNDKRYIQCSEYEQKIIENTNIPITVVSSGLKSKILKDYPNCNPERLTVIPNGTNLQPMLRMPASICCESKKIFLCIGTIQKRKNQIQLLRTLKNIDPAVRKKIRVLFIGTDNLNGSLQRMIADSCLEDVAEYIGTIDHHALDDYYEDAFAVISTSLDEAFGLTFIEGFAHGIPAVFFDTLDAVKELYSPDAVELISGKEDDAISFAISNAIKRQWDKEKIKQFAKKFDICNVSNLYEKAYRKVCNAEKGWK